MSELRIKMKIADYEFEAEGSNDIVLVELANFKRLLPTSLRPASLDDPLGTYAKTDLSEILRIDGRVISLRIRIASLEDAVLTILAGQRIFRNNQRVTGAEIMDGLRASGQPITRVDHWLRRHAANGTIAMNGKGRSRRYRLTNAGIQKANASAQKLAAQIKVPNQE